MTIRQIPRSAVLAGVALIGACGVGPTPRPSLESTSARGADIDGTQLPAAELARPLDGKLPVPIQLDASIPTPVDVPAPGVQRAARIAGGAGIFLAVWEDLRDGKPTIVGARIDPALGVLDPQGLPIAPAPASAPRVAFDGTRFVVAWSTGTALLAAYVDPKASLATAVGPAHVIASPSTNQPFAIAAANASQFVLLSATSSDPRTIESHWIDSTQATWTPVVRQLGPSAIVDAGTPADLAACGSVYRAIVASPQPEVSKTKVVDLGTDGGEVVGVYPLEDSASQAAIACGASQTFVALTVADGTLRAKYIDTFGSPKPIAFKATGFAPRAAFAGANFVLTWTGTDGFSFNVVGGALFNSSSGASRLPDGFGFTAPDVAATTDATHHVLFSYEGLAPEPNATDVSIYGSFGATPFPPTPEFPIATSLNAQRKPALALFAGGGFAGWSDYRVRTEGAFAPRTVRLNGSGMPEGEAVDWYGAYSVQLDPRAGTAAASDGLHWLVAAPAQSDLVGSVRVFGGEGLDFPLQGSLEPFAPFTDTRVVGHIGAAVTGDRFTVVYTTSRIVTNTTSTLVPNSLEVARVKTSDLTLSSAERFALVGSDASAPTIASTSGGKALIVVEKSGDLYAATLGATGVEPTFGADAIVHLPGTQKNAALAFREDANEGLLVWEDESAYGLRVRAVRVDSNGKALDVEPVTVSGELASTSPSVIVDGAKYLVAWSGSLAGGAPQIYATAVHVDGHVAAGTPSRLSASLPADAALSPNDATPYEAGSPHLARDPSGRVWLAYEQWLPKLRVPRVVSLILPPEQALGVTCASDTDCDSRRCVDGVCCATACEGTCERCTAPSGTCEPVTAGPDDHCVLPGALAACDAKGTCKAANGEACVTGTECASGHCVDTGAAGSVCCESTCDGSCDSCASPGLVGTCVTKACGTYTCAPRTPDDAARQCLTSCRDTTECASGFQCVSGACITPPSVEPMATGCAIRDAGEGDAGRSSGRGFGLLGVASLLLLRGRRRVLPSAG